MKNCAYCNKKLPKGKRKFCCNKHKDRYHNLLNPRGMYAPHKSEGSVQDDSHSYDPYALGQD